MNDTIEPSSIGLSEKAHNNLKKLKEDGHFDEMIDAYRLGISIALAKNIEPDEISGSRQTIFSVSTLDPKGEIAIAIKSLCPKNIGSTYKYAERLAEWGVNELAKIAAYGEIDFNDLAADI